MLDIDDKVKFRCSAGPVHSSRAGSSSVLLLLRLWRRGRWREAEYERGPTGHLWWEEKHRLQLCLFPLHVLLGFPLCDDDRHQLVQLWKCQHWDLLQRELVHLLGQDGFLLDMCSPVPGYAHCPPLSTFSAVLRVRIWAISLVLQQKVMPLNKYPRSQAVTGTLWQAGIPLAGFTGSEKPSGEKKKSLDSLFVILKFKKKLPICP